MTDPAQALYANDGDLNAMRNAIEPVRMYLDEFDRSVRRDDTWMQTILERVRWTGEAFTSNFDTLGEQYDNQTGRDVPRQIQLMRDYVILFDELYPAVQA